MNSQYTPLTCDSKLSPTASLTATLINPCSDVFTDSPSGSLSGQPDFAIQIHETYDIQNDDINEDVFVSYDIFDNGQHHASLVEKPHISSTESNRADLLALTQQETFISNINNKLLFTYDDQPNINKTHFRSTLENAFIKSNSPISSQSNSDSEPDEPMHDTRYMINEQVENAFENRKMRFKKITYEEIEKSLSKYYDKNNKYSNEVDILITFIRGQKHLYNQSNLITQTKLYAITITALAITSVITVITPFIQQYWWKTIFVMAGNAATTVLITILKYMRFESASNTFTLLANHYEHYEKSLQLTTNKLVFVTDESEQNKIVLEKMREIEFKISETNELCPVIIPSEVQTTFPVIYQTNIFTLIKKMDVHRKTLIIQLKNIKNEIRYILFKWNMAGTSRYSNVRTPELRSNERVRGILSKAVSVAVSKAVVEDLSSQVIDTRQHNNPSLDNPSLDERITPQMLREKVRVLFLMEQKERVKKELVEYRDNYSQIDELFMKEIKYAELNKKCWRWFWCNPKKIQYDTFTNPIIKEHLELILGN
jgi:hypothetical protein